MNEKRIAVITAFTAGYDRLDQPKISPLRGTDFFAFTESAILSSLPEPWRFRMLPALSRVGKRNCLFVKTHMGELFPEYEYLIWLDARLTLTREPRNIVDVHLDGFDLASFRHPRNFCLSQEMSEIAAERLVPADELSVFQSSLTRDELHSGPNSETNVLVARNNAQTRDFFSEWWALIESAPARDQLTFDLAIRRSTVSFRHFDGGQTEASNCNFVLKGKHLKNRPNAVRQEREGLPPSLLSPPSHAESDLLNVAVNSRDVSVVIPVHNARTQLAACLESVIRGGFDGPVFLVDNGSDTETSDFCRLASRRNQCVHHDYHREPLGFGGAVNRGINSVETKFSLVLNSDVVLPESWVKLLTTMKTGEGILATGFVSNFSGDHSVGRSIFESDISLTLRKLGLTGRQLATVCSDFCSSWWNSGQQQLVRLVHGSAMLLNNGLFQQLGGFDTEAFPHGYGEEVDLFLRGSERGLMIGLYPGLFYLHEGRASFGIERRNRLNSEGKAILQKRYSSRILDSASDDVRRSAIVRSLDHDLTRFVSEISVTQPERHET